MKAPSFYASLGMPFYWISQDHTISLSIVAVPLGWACQAQHPDHPRIEFYVIPDKEHGMNPRSLWNSEAWGDPITTSDAYEHQHLADALFAFSSRDWRKDKPEVPQSTSLVSSSPTDEEIDLARYIAHKLDRDAARIRQVTHNPGEAVFLVRDKDKKNYTVTIAHNAME